MQHPETSRKVVLILPVFDEEDRIAEVIRRVPGGAVGEILVVDDGSREGSAECARRAGATVISHPARLGVGAAIRTGIAWARERNFEIACVAAGNGKDAPEEIGRLLERIEGGLDFVQGSRYLPGARHGGMPRYRRWATRVHPLLFSLACRRRVTDSTNGFRAFRLSLLDDPRIRVGQRWLDGYELEPYLLFRAIRLGYRVGEAPVTKIYPPAGRAYTKMRPITGWWQILRPILYLALGWKT